MQAILKTLSITHVSLIGHSSGVIYVLNTILSLRHLLPPDNPYVALVSPWIHPAHSRTLTSATGNLLPNQVINYWYDANYIISRSTYPMLGPSTARPASVAKHSSEHSRAVSEKILAYALKENVSGIAQEAQFCLKRGDDGIWGEIKSYEQFVHLLKEREEGYQQKQQQQGKHDVNKLHVDTFFAASDQTSGSHGGQYFDNAWRKVFQGDDKVDDECVVYGSSTVPGTTHETIMRPESGVLGYVFEKVKRGRSPSPPHPRPSP